MLWSMSNLIMLLDPVGASIPVSDGKLQMIRVDL